MALLAAAILVGMAQVPDVETRTLLTGPKGGQGTQVLLFERVTCKTGFVLVTKAVLPDGNIAYASRSYDMKGHPVESSQEGQWGGQWNVFQTKYGKDGCVQSINGTESKCKDGAKSFADPTTLWFWKIRPKVGTSETVLYLAQNTVATNQIRFTYEGDETMELAGRNVTVHRVRETPLDSPEGVYTIWWYDGSGMGVKRYHKTTTSEYRYDLLAWR